MKIVIVGKGGVGKTTIAATLSRLLGREGYRVIAVDADPSLNLAQALGVPRDLVTKVPPLFNDEEFIRSRTTVPGGLYKLNPKVDDVVEKYGIVGPDNVVLLRLGEIRQGGTRCLCPEYAFLRALMSHLILGRKDVVVIDMVAGLEPFSRGAIRGVDYVLCVVEPTVKSLEVAAQSRKLAKELGVRGVFVVANKVRGDDDIGRITKTLGEKPLASLPLDENVVEADREGIPVLDYNPEAPFVKAVAFLKSLLINNIMFRLAAHSNG